VRHGVCRRITLVKRFVDLSEVEHAGELNTQLRAILFFCSTRQKRYLKLPEAPERFVTKGLLDGPRAIAQRARTARGERPGETAVASGEMMSTCRGAWASGVLLRVNASPGARVRQVLLRLAAQANVTLGKRPIVSARA
jgi:hypothetical protein